MGPDGAEKLLELRRPSAAQALKPSAAPHVFSCLRGTLRERVAEAALALPGQHQARAGRAVPRPQPGAAPDFTQRMRTRPPRPPPSPGVSWVGPSDPGLSLQNLEGQSLCWPEAH